MPTNRRRSHHGEAYRRGSHGRGNQAGSAKSITVDVPLPLLGVVLDTREAFHELCIRTGREVLLAMMEADREGLCGPKGRHQANRRAWRGGSTSSRVTLGGRQVELARLRVRSPQTGYSGVKPGTLAEPRGGPADEDEAIVTPLFPARLRGRSSRAA